MASKFVQKAVKILPQPSISAAPIRSDNKITVPHKTVRILMDTIKKCQYRKELHRVRNQPSIVEDRSALKTLVRCVRKRLNHYEGQTYPYVDTRFLASHGWRNSRSNGDKFVINMRQSNPTNLCDNRCFEQLPEFLKKALEGMGILRPTKLQADVLEHYDQVGNHILCASHTGSGKTLAYLVPIIKYLMLTKTRAITLLPSLELCNQLESVCGSLLSENQPVSVCSLMNKALKPEEFEQADLLLGTPAKVLDVEDILQNSVRPIRNFVVDEADTLLDCSFCDDTLSVINRLGIGLNDEKPWARVMFISATLSDKLMDKITTVVQRDLLSVITSNSINLVLPHIPQYFYRVCSLKKLDKLVKILQEKPGDSSIIFCKSGKAAVWLNCQLRENGIRSDHLSSIRSGKDREKILNNFKNRSIQCVCCTDALSRGIDTQWVNHVVNYDFPTDLRDYIHRCGRVGRLGSKIESFRITNFISKVHEATAAQAIEMAARGMIDLSKSIDLFTIDN